MENMKLSKPCCLMSGFSEHTTAHASLSRASRYFRIWWHHITVESYLFLSDAQHAMLPRMTLTKASGHKRLIAQMLLTNAQLDMAPKFLARS